MHLYLRMNTSSPFEHVYINSNAPVELSCLSRAPPVYLPRCHALFKAQTVLCSLGLFLCYILFRFRVIFFVIHRLLLLLLPHSPSAQCRLCVAWAQPELRAHYYFRTLPTHFLHRLAPFLVSQSVKVSAHYTHPYKYKHIPIIYFYFHVDVVVFEASLFVQCRTVICLFYLSVHAHKKCTCVITFFYAPNYNLLK